MIDKTIPYKNIIMKCDQINANGFSKLSDGFYFKMFEDGDEVHWAIIETSIGDFDTYDEALKYFKTHYLSKVELLKKRCVFVFDHNKQCVATCTAWHDKKDSNWIPSLHWLATLPKYQGKGIGRALLSKILMLYQEHNENEIYLHTQPWSYKAIKLYLSLGFYLVKKDTFNDFINEYEDAVNVLRHLLDEKTYHLLITHSK